jgi:hypothetical protein
MTGLRLRLYCRQLWLRKQERSQLDGVTILDVFLQDERERINERAAFWME